MGSRDLAERTPGRLPRLLEPLRLPRTTTGDGRVERPRRARRPSWRRELQRAARRVATLDAELATRARKDALRAAFERRQESVRAQAAAQLPEVLKYDLYTGPLHEQPPVRTYPLTGPVRRDLERGRQHAEHSRSHVSPARPREPRRRSRQRPTAGCRSTSRDSSGSEPPGDPERARGRGWCESTPTSRVCWAWRFGRLVPRTFPAARNLARFGRSPRCFCSRRWEP
jgi:hypothetical protein